MILPSVKYMPASDEATKTMKHMFSDLRRRYEYESLELNYPDVQ